MWLQQQKHVASLSLPGIVSSPQQVPAKLISTIANAIKNTATATRSTLDNMTQYKTPTKQKSIANIATSA